MGDLILFRPRPGQSSLSTPAPPNGAQIMFFTGVRYERLTEPTVAQHEGGVDPAPKENVGKSGRGRKRRRG
jgi:hypothetical protein